MVMIISIFEWSSAGIPMVYNILDYGAKPGKDVVNRGPLQKAIDACHEAGGGTVFIPADTFMTASLEMKSNVRLYLSPGALLLGSPYAKDYREYEPQFAAYTNTYQNCALLFARNQVNIIVEGFGTIDGNGGSKDFFMTKEQWRAAENELKRPYGIHFKRCKGVQVRDVTLKSSAFWMQHYLECENLKIDNITVINHANYNNDGMDINNCRDVKISNSRIYCSDDAICFKSTSDKHTENVTITNCILKSHYNGFKIGTETHGGVKNLVMNNCVISSPGYENHHGPEDIGWAGIAIESCDGAAIENISISNIRIDSMKAPIFVRLENRGRLVAPDRPTPSVGVLKNVQLSNIYATQMTKLSSSITGIPGHPVKNIYLNNIQLYVAGGGDGQDLKAEVPEFEKKYPDCVMFGTNLPSYGFFVRHVEDIIMKDVTVVADIPDMRHGIVCHDVKNMQIDGVILNNDSQRSEPLKIEDCQGVTVRNTFDEKSKIKTVKSQLIFSSETID